MASKESLSITRPHHMHLQWVATQEGGPAEWVAICGCGRRGTPTVILKHVKASRRWRYLGVEDHYGDKYHIWEHQLTGRRFAWLVDGYFVATMLGKNWATPVEPEETGRHALDY